MDKLFGDTYGLIHLIFSIFALVTGTLVLFRKKGTRQHKQTGYIYVASMVILLLPTLMIYRQFDGWGLFHYLTVAGLLTLGLGMIPLWIKKPAGKWKYLHLTFMYWSVMGLYAAFVAQILTWVPATSFFGMVGITFVVITLIAGVFFVNNRPKWIKLFRIEK